MYQLRLLQREMPSLEAQLAPPVKFNLVLLAQTTSCPLPGCGASHKSQAWVEVQKWMLLCRPCRAKNWGCGPYGSPQT